MGRTKLTKQEKSWVLYDVGNSAFVMLSSTLIPIYFASLAVEGSSVVVAWGYAETVASLLLALLMPVLGSLADLQGNKKKLRSLFQQVLNLLCTLPSLHLPPPPTLH